MSYRIVKEITNKNRITYTIESNNWLWFVSKLFNWYKPVIIDMAMYTCLACYETLEEAEMFINKVTQDKEKVIVSEIVKEYL